MKYDFDDHGGVLVENFKDFIESIKVEIFCAKNILFDRHPEKVKNQNIQAKKLGDRLYINFNIIPKLNFL